MRLTYCQCANLFTDNLNLLTSYYIYALTVPHALLRHTSTLPSYCDAPPTKQTSPSVQLLSLAALKTKKEG